MAFSLKSCFLWGSILLATTGCTAMLIASSAAVITKTATDPRTIGTQLDDSTLKLRIARAFKQDKVLYHQTNIHFFTYNKNLLLTGQIPTKLLWNRAMQVISKIEGFMAIHNQIRRRSPINFQRKTKDTYITLKIRSQLLTNKYISLNRVKVTTEAGEVFLFGAVTKKEGEIVTSLASRTQGVKKVFNLLHYL